MVFENINLRKRIYLSLILVVVFSFIVIGAITIWYTQIENERYHNQRLTRKEKAITAALSYYLEDKEEDIYTLYTKRFHEKIVKLADIHSLEVNLYDLDGRWIASSNFDFFDQGIIPEILGNTLLKNVYDHRGHFVMSENVSGEDLLTAYTFLKGANGKPIALISVPYFTNNQIQKEETSELLYALSQIYFLLMIGTLIVAFFLSNYITKSLQIITHKIRSLSLTGSNVEIKWDKKDEIGELVNEYNKKVRELKESAEQLAKNERELAWREMAKQVAHEIKNPLTPMKLSVQQLERIWKDGGDNFAHHMVRFNQTMTQQIDTLSDIATEFSNFAQLNKSKPEIIDLVEHTINCIKLFDDDNFTIVLKTDLKFAKIKMDKSHLTRIYTNMVTNSLEANLDGKKGTLLITIEKSEAVYNISLKDNGCGIDPDKLQRIFEPNFTTKNTGTGLGLAMVKGMLETANGSITVRSELTTGTTFTVKLPVFSAS